MDEATPILNILKEEEEEQQQQQEESACKVEGQFVSQANPTKLHNIIHIHNSGRL